MVTEGDEVTIDQEVPPLTERYKFWGPENWLKVPARTTPFEFTATLLT
jgi:hypothetical protein